MQVYMPSCPHLELAVTSTDAAVADTSVLVAGDVVLGVDCDLADAILLDLNLQLLHHKQSILDQLNLCTLPAFAAPSCCTC